MSKEKERMEAREFALQFYPNACERNGILSGVARSMHAIIDSPETGNHLAYSWEILADIIGMNEYRFLKAAGFEQRSSLWRDIDNYYRSNPEIIRVVKALKEVNG